MRLYAIQLCLIITVSTAAIGIASARPANCIIGKSAAVALKKYYPGWRVMSLADLLPEDRIAWNKKWVSDPGYSCGKFDESGRLDLAIILFRTQDREKTGHLPHVPRSVDSKEYDPNLQVKVALLSNKRIGRLGKNINSRPIELYSGPAPYPPVIRRAGPGSYQDLEDRAQNLFARHDVVLLEQIEAGVVAYYYHRHRISMVSLSN